VGSDPLFYSRACSRDFDAVFSDRIFCDAAVVTAAARTDDASVFAQLAAETEPFDDAELERLYADAVQRARLEPPRRPRRRRASVRHLRCAVCARTFTAKRPDARYCDAACRQRACRARRR
jgi:hypothetical protein